MNDDQKFSIVYSILQRQDWIVGDDDVPSIAKLINDLDKQVFNKDII